jgi:tryptophanyl-tRNA synthetase
MSDAVPSDPASFRGKRVLSGVQPSGRLHLGNYFGAIRQHIELQRTGAECFYFIANYHSLTTLRDREALVRNTRDVAITYLALGLDPDRTVFYRQSDVPEVAELTWLLATVTPVGLLERAHSYKEKVSKGLSANVGLFLYPTLMAADILAPQADVVPVGSDQVQHVEMARDMAQAFHAAFGKGLEPVFKLPEARLSPTPKVPGTTSEKGAVLQVNLVLAAGRPSGFDLDVAIGRLRDALVGRIAAAGEADAATTEAIDRFFTDVVTESGAFEGVAIEKRALRTLAEVPPGHRYHATAGDEGRLNVEFTVTLDHVVFATVDGRRQAAKMSKSYGNTIEIFAEGKPLKKAVMGIETMPKELHEPLDPEGDLVLGLYELFATKDEIADMVEKYRAGGFGYGNAKKALLEKIDAYFAPHRDRRRELENDPDFVEDVLVEGARRARLVIAQTLDDARSACGIVRATSAG